VALPASFNTPLMALTNMTHILLKSKQNAMWLWHVLNLMQFNAMHARNQLDFFPKHAANIISIYQKYS